MSMKKILYITTVSRTINAFLVPHIQMLRKEGNIVDCACSIDKPVEEELIKDGVKIYEVPFTRNPLHLKNYKAYKELVKIQKDNNYDTIHVHTPVASVYGRLLKLKFPKLKTIYTVHGFHFHKGAPFLNWMIYYPIERIMAKLTDIMITINREDYERASSFGVKEVYKFNGVGVDMSQYDIDSFDRDMVRQSLGLKKDDFVVLMIAEVNKNKNHKQMIEAVKILKSRGVSNIKVICAGDGVIFEEVKKEVEESKLQDNIKMLGFRNDIKELIATCDVGLLMSYREGLPRNIMELMAAKKAVIGTNIRGIRDLVIDGYNGFLVEVEDYENTANSIEYISENRNVLDELSKNSYLSIQDYSMDKVTKELQYVY